jgi:hypothetical protein
MSWFTRLFRKEKTEPDGFIRLDFTHTFPHVFWASSIGYDERSPEGFRYKVLTMRREPEMVIELVLLRESVNGTKTQLAHMQAPLDKFGATGDMVRQLGQDQSVSFERFDLTQIRTFEEFRTKAIEIGWEAAQCE